MITIHLKIIFGLFSAACIGIYVVIGGKGTANLTL